MDLLTDISINRASPNSPPGNVNLTLILPLSLVKINLSVYYVCSIYMYLNALGPENFYHGGKHYEP